MKKLGTSILALVLAVTVIFGGAQPVTVNAATNVDAIYAKYVRQQVRLGKFHTGYYYGYSIHDFNNDGVNELIVSDGNGNRGVDSVYTYYNGKIVYLMDANSLYYMPGKNYIISYGSGGAHYYMYDVYTINKGKAKKVAKYERNQEVYTKNGKKISAATFEKFENSVSVIDYNKLDLTKYGLVSAKQAGFSINDIMGKRQIIIDKVTSNKITYHEESFDGDTGEITYKGKTKSAKINSKTKFYYGWIDAYFNTDVKGIGDNRKWFDKLSKSEFTTVMKTYKDAPNVIKTKNGVATVIAINMHIAD